MAGKGSRGLLGTLRTELRLAATLAILCMPTVGLAQSAPVAPPALPDTIPIFPLPTVPLFPNTTAPLHIFEPRYRAMVADALEGDSIIGMVLLQPGYEADYEGRPPVYAVGCAGVIVEAVLLPDGRYNIVLRGISKFRATGEETIRPYRLAAVEALPETVDAEARSLVSLRRRQLEDAFLTLPGAQRPPPGLSDEEVIDGLSVVVPLEPAQRQELLEAEGSAQRAFRLIGMLRGNRAPFWTFSDSNRAVFGVADRDARPLGSDRFGSGLFQSDRAGETRRGERPILRPQSSQSSGWKKGLLIGGLAGAGFGLLVHALVDSVPCDSCSGTGSDSSASGAGLEFAILFGLLGGGLGALVGR